MCEPHAPSTTYPQIMIRQKSCRVIAAVTRQAGFAQLALCTIFEALAEREFVSPTQGRHGGLNVGVSNGEWIMGNAAVTTGQCQPVPQHPSLGCPRKRDLTRIPAFSQPHPRHLFSACSKHTRPPWLERRLPS